MGRTATIEKNTVADPEVVAWTDEQIEIVHDMIEEYITDDLLDLEPYTAALRLADAAQRLVALSRVVFPDGNNIGRIIENDLGRLTSYYGTVRRSRKRKGKLYE